MQGSCQVASQKQNEKQSMPQEMRELVVFVQEQSYADVQQLMGTLVQRGEIILDMLPDFEDEEQLDDPANLDAEMSLSDEDSSGEDDPSAANDGCDAGPFASGHEYEIMVVVEEGGQVMCNPPDNEWASARAKKHTLGNKVLYALGTRFLSFEAIAKWLETEESDILAKGADSFLAHHRKVVQKIFCDAHGLKSSSFGHHIKNAFLSWCDASIPLRKLFCD